ncbi:hypothetical protein QO010_001283 [Caulobacter ginsengisoli]|uniref:PepSY domain-containing protein n=1 Tax=Caulobacter ginsengisoli TaxID=400775 RepID=A0ABU0INC4_9CAUL|nr:PepSY domain-containing protein [Caulobacter ginsengisoli]MDQ0463512.1 hypothetical protein [Caulobacter ginsengisoli]
MKRLLVPIAVLLLGAAIPAAAQAQRGPNGGCPQGPAGRECREALRDQGTVRGGGGQRPGGWRPEAGEQRGGQSQRMVSLEQVVGRIASRTPGRLLDAGTENRGDRVVYRVRWQANDGRRIDYIVDASSGQILSANGE